ncbi:MAG: hypothetical protein ABIG64_09470, partial [Candidatus Omnitrophota bacterium]
LSNAEQTKIEVQNQLKDLTEQKKSAENNYSLAQSQLNEKDKEIEKIKSELASSDKNLKAETFSGEKLAEENKSLQKQINELTKNNTNISKLNQKLADLEMTLKTKTEQATVLQAEMDNTKILLAVEKDKIRTFENESDKNLKTIENLEAENKQLKTIKESLKKDSPLIANLQGEIEELKLKVNQSENAEKSLQQQIENLLNEKKIIMGERDLISKEKTNFNQQLANLEQAKNNLQNELNTLKEKNVMLQEEVKKSQQTLTSKSSSNQDAKIQIENLQKELDQQKNISENMTRQNSLLAAEIERLKIQTKTTGQDEKIISELKQKIKDQETEIIKQNNINADNAKQNSLLVNELNELKQNAAQNIADKQDVSGLEDKLKKLESLINEKEKQEKELKLQLAESNKKQEAISLELAKTKDKLIQADSNTQAESSQPVDQELATLEKHKKILHAKLKKAIDQINLDIDKINELKERLKTAKSDLEKSEEEKVVMAEEIIRLRNEKNKIETEKRLQLN